MDFDGLVKIMDELRAENGCPWDKEQTRESLKPFLMEEACEVMGALDEKDPDKIKEELGGLLFQIMFHARIAKEKGEFDIYDVVRGISEKMIARHPHVFGDEKHGSSEEVLKRWEEHKKREGKMRDSVLDGIPGHLPSLLKAHKLQDRASRAGFDWSRVEDVLKKLDEEMEEFKETLKTGSVDDIENELGDVFFVLVNISRFVGVNPDDALRKTIGKFIRRFRHMEISAAETGRSLSEMRLDEMDILWEAAKKGE